MTNASEPDEHAATQENGESGLAPAASDVDVEAHRGDDIGDQFTIGLASASTGGAAAAVEPDSEEPLPGESD